MLMILWHFQLWVHVPSWHFHINNEKVSWSVSSSVFVFRYPVVHFHIDCEKFSWSFGSFCSRFMYSVVNFHMYSEKISWSVSSSSSVRWQFRLYPLAFPALDFSHPFILFHVQLANLLVVFKWCLKTNSWKAMSFIRYNWIIFNLLLWLPVRHGAW